MIFFFRKSIAGLYASMCMLLLCASGAISAVATQKPNLTFDEFFNSVGISEVHISPDGHAVVIGTNRADWQQESFRDDLWLYRDGAGGNGASGMVQLTQSGHDGHAEWSPDGRWIAFVSDRKLPGGKGGAHADDGEPPEKTAQIYLISATGGEAFPITEGDEDVHSYAWTPDSKSIYFATREPWTHARNEEYKKAWKDVIQYRAAERGDQIFQLEIAAAIAHHHAQGMQVQAIADEVAGTQGTRLVTSFALAVNDLVCSPDGHRLAFASSSISHRQEKVEQYEIFVVELTAGVAGVTPRQLTHNQAAETALRWAGDSRHLFFQTEIGAIEGSRWDPQPRLYGLDSSSGQMERWMNPPGTNFNGSVQLGEYAVSGDGVIAAVRVGTQVQYYRQTAPSSPLVKVEGWSGTYGQVSATSPNAGSASVAGRLAFVYSSLQNPAEVYLASSTGQITSAQPITSFNQLLSQRELPRGKPYRWTSEDGVSVEGMLVYPPGKFEAKGLKMLTLIHGGPQDADGDHFEADWYQWTALAATQGWLVFQPNYRGSVGYGDKFSEDIAPRIVYTPGKDILTGVDALVKDGIADPEHLAIGGYSYGGYMTNWLITQTTRFKAAVTGAGAVEHAANWGNDDTTFDDAGLFGGRPWEQQKIYAEDAALNYMDRVRTPTHMVGGADDIRVAVLEDYLLDRALHSLGIPSTLLIFPGEGHGLRKNPWHGRIKVREELKWIEKYAGDGAGK